MNTRTHYRNSMLAFPKTADYGCAIERPPKRTADRAIAICLWLGAIAIVLSLLFQGAPK